MLQCLNTVKATVRTATYPPNTFPIPFTEQNSDRVTSTTTSRTSTTQIPTPTHDNNGGSTILPEVERLPDQHGDLLPAPARREELHGRHIGL